MLPAVRVSVPVLRIPGEVPGASVPPLLTVTVLPTVPVPPSVPPLFTVTGEAIEPGRYRQRARVHGGGAAVGVDAEERELAHTALGQP